MDIGIEDALLDHCLKYYGRDKQIIKTIEEMSELTKELCKDLITSGVSGNIAAIHEELADTILMVCQLIRIYGKEFVRQALHYKITRIKERTNFEG